MVLLMYRTIQDAVRREERLPGAIPVVDIPVKNGNPINALQGMLRSNRRVVQEAEPPCPRPLRVMAGWPDEGKGMFPVQGPVHCTDGTPCSMQGCIKGKGGDIGIAIKMRQKSRFRTALPEIFRIMGSMYPVHFLKRSRFRNNGRYPCRDAGECSQQAGVALRVARVFVTGAGRIDNNGAASHIRVHPLLAIR
jgi:hypothetical protein